MSIRIDGTNTAANPGITGADTDTGLQFGTNTVSLVTDGTARVDVDNDGLKMADNVKAVFGTGDDLEIYHDGSTSFIRDAGTGILALTSNGGDIRLMNGDATVNMAIFNVGGAAELYHNGSQKFTTQTNGITVGNSSSTYNELANASGEAKLHIGGGGSGGANIEVYGATHSSSPKEIRMSTNSVERFKITNTGHAEFRAASYVVEARSIAASSSSNCLYSGAHSSTGFGLGTITYEVYTNGNVKNSNNSYGQLSDVNLKENIVDATSQWDDIKALQIRKYNFREATGYDTHTQIGLVAQEVETVCPGLVSTTAVREDATPVLDAEGNALETIKSVSTSVLYMKAVKALQEAQTRIETLETQHADLLARVTALEAAE